MGYTDEEIEKAIRLAEQLAESESAKRTFAEAAQEQPGYENLVVMTRNRMGDHLEKLLENDLAEKLLPQARVVVKMEFERKQALYESTSLGELINAVGHQQQIEDDGQGWGDNSAPFKSPLDNMEWTNFLLALKQGKKVELLNALNALLVQALCDLVETDIPPVAPKYQIPE